MTKLKQRQPQYIKKNSALKVRLRDWLVLVKFGKTFTILSLICWISSLNRYTSVHVWMLDSLFTAALNSCAYT